MTLSHRFRQARRIRSSGMMSWSRRFCSAVLHDWHCVDMPRVRLLHASVRSFPHAHLQSACQMGTPTRYRESGLRRMNGAPTTVHRPNTCPAQGRGNWRGLPPVPSPEGSETDVLESPIRRGYWYTGERRCQSAVKSVPIRPHPINGGALDLGLESASTPDPSGRGIPQRCSRCTRSATCHPATRDSPRQ